MGKGFLITSAALVALAFSAACTVHQTEAPPLTGPSELAVSILPTAIPDSISQDGASQASIQIFARDADGKPIQGLAIRLDMSVGGVVQDFGLLSARTIVTGSDGKANAVYTAPPAPPPSTGGSGTRVSIVVTPIGSNFQTSVSQTVDIRLVPPGVILPSAGTPTASFTFAPTAPAANAPVQFDASASTPGTGSRLITSYSWSFGDGSQASGKLVSHAFALQQTYNVTLTVTNDRGLSASTTQSVTVGSGALPVPAFTFSPSAPAVNQTVFFNAGTSTPGQGHTIASYRWNFGDGGTASGITASHAYTTAGSFSVQLTVTDEVGQSVTSAATTVTVGASPLPTASFTFSPNAPTVNQAVFFNASTSAPGQGHTIVSYQWNFGDGATATGVTASHAYTAAGTFSVQLTVTDEIGQSVTSAATAVTVGALPLPTASFTFSPSAPAVNEAVFFNGAASTAGQGHTIVSYKWTFGDGGTATGVTASHAYAAAGTYSVQLTVTDEIGQSVTSAPTTLTVGQPPAPIASFIFSPATPTANQTVVFDASTSSASGQGQTITDYAWNFGDGSAVVHTSAKTISHTFGLSGTFSVSLVVTDTLLRTASVSNTVPVTAADATFPTASFTFTPSPATINQEVSFDGGSSTPGDGASSIVRWEWEFGDGTPVFGSNVATVGYTYRTRGTFAVRLTVTNNAGKKGSTTRTIVVQ